MEQNNNLYNLMLQYTVESRSLWRIQQDYQNDAGTDPETKALWEKLAAEKAVSLADLRTLIKARL